MMKYLMTKTLQFNLLRQRCTSKTSIIAVKYHHYIMDVVNETKKAQKKQFEKEL